MTRATVEDAVFWARQRPSWWLRHVDRRARRRGQGSHLPLDQRARVVAVRIVLADREGRR